jgi:hypothetical protein
MSGQLLLRLFHRAAYLEQWYSTGGTRTPGGTRRHPKILFFVI